MKKDLFELFSDRDAQRAAWLEKLRDSTLEIKDQTYELTASRPGRLLWDQLKENAQLASKRSQDPSLRKKAIITIAGKGCEMYSASAPEEKKQMGDPYSGT